MAALTPKPWTIRILTIVIVGALETSWLNEQKKDMEIDFRGNLPGDLRVRRGIENTKISGLRRKKAQGGRDLLDHGTTRPKTCKRKSGCHLDTKLCHVLARLSRNRCVGG